MMERNLDKRYAETSPQITVATMDDAHLIGDDIEIQISISNESGSSRANNGTFIINAINDKDVSKLKLVYVLDSPLLGGNKINAVFSVKSNLISSENIEIDYTFNYLDVRKVVRNKNGKIGLAINKGDDYEDFDNPYIAHVKSNAVKDKSMFKGRDEIIDTICKYVLNDYKGYVLYGQKRSGKSSVLYHITQRLRAEHIAFAVEYTMGNNIVQDSESESESMANLFYTIISEIGDFTRFATPNELSAYLGLVPGERSSAGKGPNLGITKLGNKVVRTQLIESAQSIIRGAPNHKSKRLKEKQKGQDIKVISYCDRAIKRLMFRYKHLIFSGLHHNKAITAIARELSCSIWGLMNNKLDERIIGGNNMK